MCNLLEKNIDEITTLDEAKDVAKAWKKEALDWKINYHTLEKTQTMEPDANKQLNELLNKDKS